MDAALRASLEAAYRGTDYCVQLPASELRLRVDRQQEDDERRLREEAGVKSHWAIVTPCNPGSQALSAQANQERLCNLHRMVEKVSELEHAVRLRQNAWARWRQLHRWRRIRIA